MCLLNNKSNDIVNTTSTDLAQAQDTETVVRQECSRGRKAHAAEIPDALAIWRPDSRCPCIVGQWDMSAPSMIDLNNGSCKRDEVKIKATPNPAMAPQMQRIRMIVQTDPLLMDTSTPMHGGWI
jgi:hypothetical protein